MSQESCDGGNNTDVFSTKEDVDHQAYYQLEWDSVLLPKVRQLLCSVPDVDEGLSNVSDTCCCHQTQNKPFFLNLYIFSFNV